MSGKQSKWSGLHYRPATASPLIWTETSTQMTVSPRSMLTPSPRLLHTELCSPEPQSRPCATPNNSRATAESEESLNSAKQRKTGEKEAVIRPDLWLKQRATFASVRTQEWGKELKLAHLALREKDRFVRDLQQIILNLEADLKQAKETQVALTQQNQSLLRQIKQTETSLKDQVNAQIQRLSTLLAASSRKLKSYVRPVPVPVLPFQDPQEFCGFLLEENRSLTADLKRTRKDMKDSFVGILEPLVCGLTAIRGDIVQLRTLLKGARAGEQVRLDVLWGARKSQEPGPRPASYSQACMQEVGTIQEALADMKKMAADLYAEQCGQGCIPQ